MKNIENKLTKDIASLEASKEINMENINTRTLLSHYEIKDLLKNLDQQLKSIENLIKGNQESKNDPTVVKVSAQLITDANRIFKT